MYSLIFDTETTGLPKFYDADPSNIENWPRLVQLSFIFTDGKDNVEFDFIIKPKGFEIPEEASRIHGISTEKAKKEGIEIAFALKVLRSLWQISDRIVAHNFDFDKSIVGAEWHRLGLGEVYDKVLSKKESYCTMKSSTALVGLPRSHGGGNKYPKLIELYQKLFKEGFDGAHNSLNDARACARCYFELIK